jgi:hypothetical protein
VTSRNGLPDRKNSPRGRAPTRAARETAERIKALDRARSALGAKYNTFQQKLDVDDELRRLVGDQLPQVKGAKLTKVDFKTVHGIRSEIGAELNRAQKAANMGADRTAEKEARRLGALKDELDAWLQARVPGIKELDAEYGTVKGAIRAAREAEKVAKRAQMTGAKTRAGGGKPGATIRQQMASTTTLGLIQQALAPSQSRRARVIEKYLMRPENTGRAMGVMSSRTPLLGAIESGLLGGAVQAPPYLIPSEREQ